MAAINEETPPNIHIYTSGWSAPKDPMVQLWEGETVSFWFEKNWDTRIESSFLVRPEAGDLDRAEQFFNYRAAEPIIIRFPAETYDLQSFSLHAVHDHQKVWANPIRWELVPITGVEGFSFEAITGGSTAADGTFSFAINIGNIDIYNTAPVWRFFNPHSGTHFFTATEQERDNWQAAGATLEGVAMFSLAPETSGSVYVHRFSHAETGRYFWSANPDEVRAWKANDTDAWTYEGGAFAGTLQDGKGLTEVYRFREEMTGHYAWTSNQAEKEDWLDNAHGWVLEGVAYYVAAENPLIA